ncbi:hypothetical protein ACQCVH_19550 [Bacillus infantis]|uniref:hypothetical protein n=1 Tax=Bacillus infantis TaxID=324767 RepID=UPI003CE6A5A5
MRQNEDGSQKKDLSLIEEASDLLQSENIDISLEDLKNLMQYSPHIKEIFAKAAELSSNSGQNVFDIIKKAISVYEVELKRDDLTFEQRTVVYGHIDKQVSNAMQQDESNKKFLGGAIGASLIVLAGGAVKFGPKIFKAIVKK